MKNSAHNSTNLLDCTLRDGGYYNSWDFKPSIVKKYFNAISHSSIQYVELGFRFKSENPILGPFAYTTDTFLKSLDLPNNKILGVMINAKDFIGKGALNSDIKNYFSVKEKSRISFVRIATQLSELRGCKPLAETLQKMGYKVMVNLMQANLKSKDELERAAQDINQWKTVEVLYFADSLGSMHSSDIDACIRTLSKKWKGPIGFHAHNNMHLALSNAIRAIEQGCEFCDSTILGMGRGAGNAQTESLLLEVKHHSYDNSIMQKALRPFDGLKRKYEWGPNSFYHFAAKHKIHPTYVQRLLSEKRYSSEYVVNTLNHLKGIKSSSYNEDNLSKITYFSEAGHQGSWNASDFLINQRVLLIGSGPSVKKYSKKINEFIRLHSPYVITLNFNSNIDKNLINAVIASNIARIMLDLDLYKSLDCNVIMPKSCFSSILKEKIADQHILDYGLSIKQNTFKSSPLGCTSAWQEVTAYSLLFLLQAAPKEIFVAGFDGYSNDDPRYRNLNEIFKLYLNSQKSIKLKSLTPSNHQFLKLHPFES